MLQMLNIQPKTSSCSTTGRPWILGIIIFLFSVHISAQSDIDLLLNDYNQRTVPYISVQELKQHPSDYLVFDTRKKEEYLVSHLPNAIWAGEVVDSDFAKAYPHKSQSIVVYCSVGIRSEDFGERLQALGYTNIKNLYGSIFAWKDKGYPVYNQNEKMTDSVHVYSRRWGKYLTTGIKVHE
jgi:rhodanese-related sulfurtransferase